MTRTKKDMKKDKEAFKKSFISILDEAIKSGYYPDKRGYIDLEELAFKIPAIAEHLSSRDFSLHYHDVFFDMGYKEKDDTKHKLVGTSTNQQKRKKGNDFLAFIDGLPYQYTFYIPLSLCLPEGINEINLTESISIIKITDLENLDFDNEYNVFINEHVTENEVYFRITSEGYCIGFADESAAIYAISKLKQFLYLSSAFAIIEHEPWKNIDALPSTHGKYPRNGPTQDVHACILIDFPQALKKYIAEITFKDDLFKFTATSTRTGLSSRKKPSLSLLDPDKLKAEKSQKGKMVRTFLEETDIVRFFLSDQSGPANNDKEAIETAIEWGLDSELNDNQTFSFIQTCIGLEAVLGEDYENERGKTSIKTLLATKAAYILSGTRSSREVTSKQMDKIYKLRSKLVHGRSPRITESQTKQLRTARSMLSDIIVSEIRSLRRQYNKQKFKF